MISEGVTTWVWQNIIELTGALLGLLYIFFSIRQHILTWPAGLLASLFYTFIFFQSGFYADMGLQVYYVAISIYGWYFWLKGGKYRSSDKSDRVPVKNIPARSATVAGIATIFIYGLILVILLNFTDSTVPYMDSLTTAFSITATWMLARKYIEHWIVWVFVDFVSAGLYLYKELWPTVVLFIVYTAMAVVGYLQWRKDLTIQIEKQV